MKTLKGILILTVSLNLIACASGPSRADLRADAELEETLMIFRNKAALEEQAAEIAALKGHLLTVSEVLRETLEELQKKEVDLSGIGVTPEGL